MNFIPCLTWIPRGVAKSTPDKLQLSTDELKRIVQETKKIQSESDDDDDDISEGKVEEPFSEEDEMQTKNEKKSDVDEESDFESKYNLNSYDTNDDDRPFFNISDVAMYVDNKDDNYITDDSAAYEDDMEDEEDFTIKENDNLLVVGHVEQTGSVLEIFIYNQDEETFYVHHDIVLPAYPLALEWLNFHSADENPGNYIAVGDMTPVIKIWDLDVVDIIEPDLVLGVEANEKESHSENEIKGHTDAVLSLSWNKHTRDILASGSADSNVIVWDLNEGTLVNKLRYHSNKVQSLQWHPYESPFLLSGCVDGFVKLYDFRSTPTELMSWSVDGEVEKVSWNLFDSFKFFCSTDNGSVYVMDMRQKGMECHAGAHGKAVTGLDMSPLFPHTLITAGMDKMVKIWDVRDGMKLIKKQQAKVGSIYTARAAPDQKLTVAIGGNRSGNCIKVVDFATDLEGRKTDTGELLHSTLEKVNIKKHMGNTAKSHKMYSTEIKSEIDTNIKVKPEPTSSVTKYSFQGS